MMPDCLFLFKYLECPLVSFQLAFFFDAGIIKLVAYCLPDSYRIQKQKHNDLPRKKNGLVGIYDFYCSFLLLLNF